MIKKIKEQEEAIRLREKGVSVKQIAKILGVSLGSVSVWVRKVCLTKEQQNVLQERQRKASSEFSLYSRMQSDKNRRDKQIRVHKAIIDSDSEFGSFSSNPQFIYGLGLYAGEGSKTQSWSISNTNDVIIASGVKFLKAVGWSTENITCRVRIHQNCSIDRTKIFWKSIVPGAKVLVSKYTDRRPYTGLMNKGAYHPHGVCRLEAQKSFLLLIKTLRWIEIVSAI